MAEEKIELTLPKEEEMTLTLHPEEKKEEPKKPVEIVKMEDSLSEAERKQVEDFSKQIDITEFYNMVLMLKRRLLNFQIVP